MARDDDWDDDDEDDRPRSRKKRARDEDDEDEDDDYDRPRRRRGTTRSGAVTVLGVINIVLGSIGALGSLCMTLGGILFAGGAVDMNQVGGANRGAGGLFAVMGAVVIVLGIVGLLFGVGTIMAGVGVIKRRGWGRVLTLVLATFTALGAIFSMIGLIGMIGSDEPNKGGQIVGSLFSILFQVGYAVLAYAILLNGRYASEFR